MMPCDAMRNVPPLPGMGGSDIASSCAGGTPMGSGYGSFAGSPHMSPMGMDQNGGMLTMTAPNGQVQMVSSCGGGLPPMPAWPFNGGNMMPATPVGACNMATVPQGSVQTMHASADQQQVGTYCLPLPAMQPAPGSLPSMPSAMPNMMNASTVGGNDTPHPNSISCMNQMPNCANPSWQQAESQHSPFPMPLSPPHDLAQSCTPSQPQQQAYFQMMPTNGQARNDNSNPFCL